ncbi:hypothetical protein BDF14DRAFT_1784403 [Spinellus fusiger]|nr:hypothetical protein BDF14DRAFT_1784403 [Spinellus fusiger]
MGVQGLWSLTAPAARPFQLDTLHNHILAVDASIWIHQCVRSMRDQQGNPIRNAHLVGFFRRLCKLLFHHIKPVFVFDGGVPSLKRRTIQERRRQRQGAVRNLKQTAQKLLQAQIKSSVLKAKAGDMPSNQQHPPHPPHPPHQPHDPYELPLAAPLPERDTRLATHEEMASFVNEYMEGIDIDSEEFHSLPPEIQYEIVQDLAIKSRQTSWDRLNTMLQESKDDLDFSKQQIKQLAYRSKMTQRMMHMHSGDTGHPLTPIRIASERGRAYVLYKNENVKEGLGWRLPGVSNEDPMDPGNVKKGKPTEEAIEGVVKEEEMREDEMEDEDEMEEFIQVNGNGEDKVMAAIQANSRLASLLSSIESEDQDNEPLMAQTTPTFIEKEESASDKETFDHSVGRIHTEEIEIPPESSSSSSSEEWMDMDEKTMHRKWLSRISDAFIYNYSFNDEYEQLIHNTVFEMEIEKLKVKLTSVKKTLGKTSDRNVLLQECHRFHRDMLKDVIAWKERQPASSRMNTSPPLENKEEERYSQPLPFMNEEIDTPMLLDRSDAFTTTSENEEIIIAHTQDMNISNPEEAEAEAEEEHQGYSSEEEAFKIISEEQDEYARFVSDISTKDIDSVRRDLNNDMERLHTQYRKDARKADEITNSMIQDIQELLRLFGVPFVMAPMEAEAQCAELLNLSLVDGIVTDDSDVFLFGASCVYLLGSDYTPGIVGVGPVTAMEILAEFSEIEDTEVEDPLRRFHRWYQQGIDTTDFQRRFRKKNKVLEIPEDFPNSAIKNAYYNPLVDSSPTPFQWGTPQLDSLRLFLMDAFGWSESKTDEVLIPVMREMTKRAVSL